jgi:hypothetical protein
VLVPEYENVVFKLIKKAQNLQYVKEPPSLLSQQKSTKRLQST